MEITEMNTILLLTASILLLILLITCFGMFWCLIRINRGMETMIAAMRRQQSPSGTRPPEATSLQEGDVRPVPCAAPECHRTVEIFRDCSDIGRSMEALTEKYSLDSITLASPDGLVIASSDPDADQIAAQYSHMMKKGTKPEDPRTQVFEMHYRGSPLVGIIRVGHPLPATWLSSIEEDARKILNWWLS
jgi:hypothetical protein